MDFIGATLHTYSQYGREPVVIILLRTVETKEFLNISYISTYSHKKYQHYFLD